MGQSQSLLQKVIMEQIARHDMRTVLFDNYPNKIQAKYGDAPEVASVGLSSVHINAIYGGPDIDFSVEITESSLTTWDSDKNFPLHLAAASGRLFAFPIEKVPVDQMHYINADGCSVFDLAHYYENSHQLPTNLRSCKFRQKRIPKPKSEPVIEAARMGKLKKKLYRMLIDSMHRGEPFPIPSMLHAIFLKPIHNDRHGSTLLHLAAENESFGEVSIEVLTEETLLLRDRQGRTPLHRISSLDSLESLRPEIVTRKVLTAKDHRGISVADVLVDLDTENVVPENIRLLARRPVIERIERLATQSPDAAKEFWTQHGREQLTEHEFNELLRDKRLRRILCAIQNSDPLNLNDLETGDLLFRPSGYAENPALVHLIAQRGLLQSLPDGVIATSILSCHDDSGRTPVHYATEARKIGHLPPDLLTKHALLAPDNHGVTSIEIASGQDSIGSVPLSLFDRDLLLSIGSDGKTVADRIEERGNTPLLPPELRFFSRMAAARELEKLFSGDFLRAEQGWSKRLSEVIGKREFDVLRIEFIKQWAGVEPDWKLDEEQSAAVAEHLSHIQVTARAGSGKTRTLVARALFQIQHCRIPASSILILAFNKKAVEEIRERLSKYLSEEKMPHVLTFHALAYRIVRPSEDLIFDEGETKESQVFSTTIQRIIDDGMRGGTLEEKLRELMEARWGADLRRIISLGFNLPQEEFLAHRANLPRTTMNGRRVDSEEHKHIGNSLLRLGIRYSYRRGIHRAAGTAYAPDFSHYHKETDQRFLIEVLGEDAAQANAARQAFWNSERSANAHLVHLTAEDCQDPDATLERLAGELASRGIAVSPMSDDELWLALRDDVIRDFTKAVRGFISRCQKELISPDRLDGMLPNTDPELWRLRPIGYNRYIKEPTVDGMQVRFWRLCSGIYRRYRQVLAESHQTDFDQLMLDAAGMIREGNTGFSSDRGRGDIRQIRHLLIDEYQDFSHLFEELRKSIIAQSPDANFFCVGDDWQAINKFAGSDLRYFTGFTETFEPSVRKLITRNYRSCRKIVEIGNRVMHGQGEPSVPNSSEQGNTWRVEVGDYGNLSEAEEIVVEELGDDALAILRIASDCTSRGESVAILSRTSSVTTSEVVFKLERWQERLRSFLPEKARGLLEVSTTHGYKGKEADVVILLDPEAYPFVHPDAIFNTIFGDDFQSIEDDEKRLFYVGVTRPKKSLYLLSYPSRYSETRPYRISFLANAYPPSFDINRLKSKLLCGSRVVVRLTNRPGINGNGGTFPIKDQLKESEFKWNEERKIWAIFLERGSINSPFECVQYLNAQPWIRNADGIVASFAWEDQKHRFRIEKGQVSPDGGAVSGPENPVIIGGQWQPIPGWTGGTRSKMGEWPTAKNALSPQAPAEPPPGLGAASLPSASGIEVHHTRVAGVTYENRAPAIRRLRIDEAVMLMRRPNNPKDANAIEVVSARSESLGYIPATLAARLARRIDLLGGQLAANVTEMHPGEADGSYLSVSIKFEVPGTTPAPPDIPSPSSIGPPHTSRSTVNNPKASERLALALAQARAQMTAKSAKGIDSPRRPPTPPTDQIHAQSSAASHTTGSPSSDLTPKQQSELVGLADERLRSLIADLYLSGICPWPMIGYEGRDANERCTNSILEVAWPDQKIGIYLPTNDVTTFAATGWVILPVAVVSVEMLRSILSSSITPPSEPPRVQPQVDPPVVSPPQTVPCDRINAVTLDALSQKQREDLENLLEPRLAPLIAELYLTGCSDWPEIGYEGRDSDGRCTGSMLEVAWLDFKIGIAIPVNDFRSFADAGWAIFPAASVTTSELRDQFAARTEPAAPATPAATIPPTQPNATVSDVGVRPSRWEYTDTNIHIRHGQFYDEQPDDDIPF